MKEIEENILNEKHIKIKVRKLKKRKIGSK